MWQLRVICIVLSAIYAQEITAKTLSTLITGKVEDKNVTVVGGHDIDIKEAPFQVSVERRFPGENSFFHFCGGSIIANDIILTAAHCVYGASIQEYQIRVGSTLRESGGLLVPVVNFKYNPNFDPETADFDVALFKLKTPLKFSDTVKHIDLIADGEIIADGAVLNVTGWGYTDKNESSLSMILQQASVHKVNDEVCRYDYREYSPITPRMLCAGEPGGGKDACQGDSGGPLVYNGKLAGVVSWGIGCAEPNYPGVYSKLSDLRKWIDDSIKHLTVSVVGGHDIDIKEAPFQVSVERRFPGEKSFFHFCGGSIIANDIILTAANCVYRASKEEYQIRVGSSLRESGGSVVPVANITSHPNFSIETADYDVAFFKLQTPLEFSDSVKAIDLMADGENIIDGAMFTVTGWGDTKENETSPSKILQQATVHQVNDEVCHSYYKKYPPITPRMLCAGEPDGGKDACQGDSGSPLVYNGKLAGVVSWGVGCGEPNYPGVYSKVSALRKWIDDSIKHLTGQHDSVH